MPINILVLAVHGFYPAQLLNFTDLLVIDETPQEKIEIFVFHAYQEFTILAAVATEKTPNDGFQVFGLNIQNTCGRTCHISGFPKYENLRPP